MGVLTDTTMNAEPAASEPKGPFASTEVKTIEITGPIKITLTTRYDSSHVPPPSSGAGDRERSLFDVLQPIAEMILSKLDEIRAAQQPADDIAQH